MNNNTTFFKRAGMAVIFSFLLLGSINLSAQKRVYDVIPGSGPKKQKPTTNSKSLPDIIRGDNDKRNDDNRGDGETEFTKRKKAHLPPGQAKKIYGGSAKDYAPGQVKKRKYGNGNKHGKYVKHDKRVKNVKQ